MRTHCPSVKLHYLRITCLMLHAFTLNKPATFLKQTGELGPTVSVLGRVHCSLTVPLFTQVYKWVNGYRQIYCWGKLCDGLASHPGTGTPTPSPYMVLSLDLAPAWWATWLECRLYLYLSFMDLQLYQECPGREGVRGGRRRIWQQSPVLVLMFSDLSTELDSKIPV